MSCADSPEAIDSLVAEFLEARQSGRCADCDKLLQQHPEVAAQLAEFLDDYDQIERRFAPLRKLSGATPCDPAEMPTLRADDTAAPSFLPSGTSFGDYELLDEVARGGMGVVYKARQRSLNRIVALKMILAGDGGSTTDRNRFLAEARAVARLNHPHIVPIYDVGERDGQPFFTMEFFTGGSLRDKLDALRDDQRNLAKKMIVIARAVEHAHRRGILHRDLKPTNVLLDERGEPHVTDFGLARRLDEESDLTQAGAIVGTPSYMAPEQAQAQTDLTTAVDVYGLGALMYELLAGRPPFKGSTPLETMMAAVSQEPQRPRKLVPQADPDLETICLKCLEKDPLRRYSSADALADDLERWFEGKPIQARPATGAERLMKWSRRQPLLAGSLATVGLAIVGLLSLAGVLWQNAEARAQAVKNLDEAKTQLAQVDVELQQAETRKTTAEKLADEQRALAEQQKNLAEKIAAEVKQLQDAASNAQQELSFARAEARRTTYAADMQLANVAWQGDNFSTANELVERYRNPAAGEADVRGFEWRYLHRQLHAARLSWRDEGKADGQLGSIVGMAVSPDGKTLATAQIGNHLKLWSLADGKLLKTIETRKSNIKGMSFGNLTGVFFEDEGRQLVAVIRKDFDMRQMDRMVNEAMARKEKLSSASLGSALELQVAAVDGDGPARIEPFDAKRLATAVFPVMAGGLVVVDEGDMLMVMAIDRSADGRFLALAGTGTKVAGGDPKSPGKLSGGRLVVWDLQEGRIHAQQPSPVPLTAVAFSPAGEGIAVATADGAVGIGKRDLAQPPQLLLGHSGYVYALKFNGDGSRLASGAMDSLAILWDVAEAKEVERFRGHTSAVSRIEWSPDGTTLVTGALNGEVKVWDVHRSNPEQVLRGHEKAVGSMTFTDAGQRLASADLSGSTRTWNLPQGDVVSAATPENLKNLMIIRISPSGRKLVWKNSLGNEVIVQDIASGKETRLSWNGHHPFLAVFSSDETLVAAADTEPGGLVVWSIADGKQQAALDAKGLSFGLVFSSDGKRIAAAQGKGILLWDWQSGESRRIMDEGNGDSLAVAFSPDDRLIAAALETGRRPGQVTVRVWDLIAGRMVTEFVGAGQQVRHLAFSPDGLRLATGGTTSAQRGILKLWDMNGGREVFSAPLPPAVITSIAWSPDGLQLAAAVSQIDVAAALTGKASPGNIYVWDSTPIATMQQPGGEP